MFEFECAKFEEFSKREVQGPLSNPLIQENPCEEKLEQSVLKNKLFQWIKERNPKKHEGKLRGKNVESEISKKGLAGKKKEEEFQPGTQEERLPVTSAADHKDSNIKRHGRRL